MAQMPNPDGLVLYGSPRSPFVRKVRIVLAAKGVTYQWRTDYYEFLATLNPLGKVPVLHVPGEGMIYDSRVICEFLESMAPSPRMIPIDRDGRLCIKRWEALADGICDAAVLIVNEQSRKHAATRSEDWIKHQQEKIERSLELARSALGSRRYCYGDDFTLADAALCAALGYVGYRLPHIDWRRRFPELKGYAEQMDGRADIRSTNPT